MTHKFGPSWIPVTFAASTEVNEASCDCFGESETQAADDEEDGGGYDPVTPSEAGLRRIGDSTDQWLGDEA